MYYDTPSVNNILYSSIAVSPVPNITMSLDTTQNIYTFSAPYPFIIYPFEGSELYGLQRDYLMIAQKPPSCIPTTLSNAYSIQCARSPNLGGPNIIYVQCDEWINNKLFHSTIYDRLFGEIILNSDENYVEQTSFTKKTNVIRSINNIKKLNKLSFKFYSDRQLTQLYIFNGKQWDMELLLQYNK